MQAEVASIAIVKYFKAFMLYIPSARTLECHVPAGGTARELDAAPIAAQPSPQSADTNAIANMWRVVDKAIITAFRARVIKHYKKVATRCLVTRVPLSFD